MGIEYYFNNLDPTSFQRLINAILVSKFGEAIRLLPLRGRDGGRDAETPPGAPIFDVNSSIPGSIPGLPFHGPKGRYLFQVKHHRTIDVPLSTVRNSVVSEFESEIANNVLGMAGDERVNYFFLITNVPASKEAVAKIDEKRRDLRSNGPNLHAEVLWGEHVTAWLDQSPQIWSSFPDIFAGRVVPRLGAIAGDPEPGLPRSVRAALAVQFAREGIIRFQQLRLEEKLTSLFVDLAAFPSPEAQRIIQWSYRSGSQLGIDPELISAAQMPLIVGEQAIYYSSARSATIGPSCTRLLILDAGQPEQPSLTKRVILEGGPGQGKSTMTQMVAQIYRAMILDRTREYLRFGTPAKARLPVRIELRIYAEWMEQNHGTVEEFIARTFSKDSGNSAISVDDIHKVAQDMPLLLIFDGLDEIGSDESRDSVLTHISECLERLETGMKADVKVILTTRPPAIAGRSDRINGFVSLKVASLDDARMDEYISRWTLATCSDADERQRVTHSFNKRRQEPHVKALAQNPMQLSVLLHLIRSQGEAFPDRRAELYRDYFKTVIDRDVEKTPRLRTLRGDIEALHQLVAFRIHSWAETERSSGSISRDRLISVVEEWLRAEDQETGLAKELFRLGEERLGLIVALTGEGGETRYGFEIQPVREYFAAAYINERISGNAHDLFEAMARRSFWREVALLLAGLRRANEKADLLSRAKNLDDDPEFNWRQDGRNMVLDLLQEGVLASPGGVQRDAILFLLQALDPSDRQPRNDALEMLSALPGIMKACSAQSPQQLIARFLAIGASIFDAGALEGLYRVAYKTLGASAMEEHLKGLDVEGSELSALRHIAWPDSSRLSLWDLSRGDSYWPDSISRKWSAVWYAAAVEDPVKAALRADVSYHPLLLECFAWNSIFPSTWAANRGQLPSTPLPWAIWCLRDNLLFLSMVLPARQNKEKLVPPLKQVVDYSGLNDELRETMKILIESSSEIGEHLDNRSRMLKSFDQFFLRIVEGMELDGIPGLVACRCATSLIEAKEAGIHGPYRSYVDPDGSVYWVSSRSGSLGIDRLANWRRLRKAVPEFYRTAGTANVRKMANEGIFATPPDQVRVASSRRPAIAMLQDGTDDADLEFPWSSGIPVPRTWLQSMLSIERARLPKLLDRLSACHSFNGPQNHLPAPIIHKILGVVRRTEDKAVCAGALVALLGSKFWAMAENKIILKMIRCDSERSDIASRLFDVGPERDESRTRRLEICQAIINGEILASRSTAVAAARYLAANATFALPPLSSLPVLNATRN